MDGNYGSSQDLRVLRTRTNIRFDGPRHRCLRRVLKRMVKTKSKIDFKFLRWIWKFNGRDRRALVHGLATSGRFADATQFLAKL